MFLTVGIHENLVLDAATTKINDKGTLVIGIKQSEGEDDLLSAMESSEVMSKMSGNLMMFPPMGKTFDGDAKTAADLVAEMLVMRHQLLQYAMIFTTKEKANAAIGGTRMFADLGFDLNEKEIVKGCMARLTDETFRQSVATNLGKLFIELLNEVGAFTGEVSFRQKFLRASANKHYPSISTSSFDTWIEPMTVPKEQSKVAFTAYEISKKKNDPTPIAASSTQATPEVESKAASLFGAETTNETADAESEDKPSLV